MKLTILGSGTHIPAKNRSNPAYLLDIDGETILLDCGSGTLRQIAKANRSEWEIDKIFLSHLHIDHTQDLIPLFFTYKNQHNINISKKIIPIFAHLQFSEMLTNLEKIYEKWIKSENRQYIHFPLQANQTLHKKFKIETFAANHTENSLIYKFTNAQNRTFVYSGDTAPTEELIRASYRADLLLLECTLRDDSKIEGHLRPKDVKSIISAAKPSKTIITHINPENDDGTLLKRIDCMESEIIIAEDLQEFPI